MESPQIKNLILDGDTLIVRTGDAPEIVLPQTIKLDSIISGPADYFLSKKKAGHEYELEHCLLQIDRDNRKLILSLNDKDDSFYETITGILFPFKDLPAFKINTNYRWSTKGLKDFIKMNRVYFQDKDAHRTLVTNLTNFKAKIDTFIEDSNDSKGNKTLNYAQNLETDISLDFQLTIPIFKGLEPSTFKVEVNFDTREKTLELWLESVELKELQDSMVDNILNGEIARLKAIPFLEV